MRIIDTKKVEKTIVLGLDSGDDLLKSVKEVIEEENITNGVIVSGAGSLAKAHYHIVEPGDDNPWKDLFIKKEGTIEVMSLSGIIANKEPHLHISLSQKDKAYGGHLEEGCEVLTLLEVVILKLTGEMIRKINSKGYGQIFNKD